MCAIARAVMANCMSKSKQIDQFEITLGRILWHQIARDLPNSQVALRSQAFRQSRLKLLTDVTGSFTDEDFGLVLAPDHKTSQILELKPGETCEIGGRFSPDFKRPRSGEDAVIKYLLALKLTGTSTGQAAQYALDQLAIWPPANMRRRLLKKSLTDLQTMQAELDAHFMETLMHDGA